VALDKGISWNGWDGWRSNWCGYEVVSLVEIHSAMSSAILSCISSTGSIAVVSNRVKCTTSEGIATVALYRSVSNYKSLIHGCVY